MWIPGKGDFGSLMGGDAEMGMAGSGVRCWGGGLKMGVMGVCKGRNSIFDNNNYKNNNSNIQVVCEKTPEPKYKTPRFAW